MGLSLLVASLALAAYGQHIIDDAGTLGSNWPLLSTFDDELTAIYRQRQSLAFAIPLFIVAVGLFLWSLRLLMPAGDRPAPADETPAQDWLTAGWRMPGAGALAVLAVGGWGFLIARLAAGGNQDSNWWLFWGSLGCALAALAIVDIRRGASLTSTLRWHPLELLLVAAIVGIFVGLMVQDLTDWRYARIGDEGIFFEYGQRIADGEHSYNYFTFRGPMGVHPMLSSVYQGLIMRVFGVDMFGWKLASTIAIAASLPVFYWLVRTLLGIRPAIFGTAIMGSSHYLFAYAHTGYLNIFALFPTILSFALFAAGLRGGSALLLFGSGAAAGFGFYTFYSARTAIVILGVVGLILALGARRAGFGEWLRRVPLPLVLGFAFTVTPIFAVDGWAVIEAMQEESLFSGRSLSEGLGFIVDNLPRAFLAFNYQQARHHYVSGSLLDEVSAVLAILGLGYALYRLREPGHRFIAVWAILAIGVTGVLHPRPLTELPSRMHYALPAMAALAGIGIDSVVAGIASISSRKRVNFALGIAAFAVVIPAVLGFNVHRFWWETPSVEHLSATTVVYREARSERCDVDGQRNVVFARSGSYGSVKEVFAEYRLEDESPLVLPYTGPQRLYEALVRVTRVSCIMFMEPEREEAVPVLQRYLVVAGEREVPVTIATDTSGKARIFVVEWGR